MEMAPDRCLTAEERIRAAHDAATLWTLRRQSRRNAALWLKAVPPCYWSEDVPETKPTRSTLVFHGRRDGQSVVVEVHAGDVKPLNPFMVGDSWDWGPNASSGARERLACAIIEEATGSHDAAFDNAKQIAAKLVSQWGDAWELTQPRLLEHLAS